MNRTCQDWEWEVADPARIDEYLNAYHVGEFTDDERFTLMETLIQAFDDLRCHWKRMSVGM